MRISQQGAGWVDLIFSNEQMRFFRQGVVKKEYSIRENEMFLPGGWGEMILRITAILKNWFNSKKSFLQARPFFASKQEICR